jgi:hypothetical protein
MKIYNVYIKKDSENPLETAKFIREGGFNLIAAVLHFMWALVHKMWFWSAICFITLAILTYLGSTDIFVYEAVIIMRIGHFCWIGLNANDWHASTLEKQGYVLSDIVAGNTELEAQTKFIRSHSPA